MSKLKRLTSDHVFLLATGVLAAAVAAAVFAPWLGTSDPSLIDPMNMNLAPGSSGLSYTPAGDEIERHFRLGTDGYGRDLFSRILYGGRVSLAVGLMAALAAVCLGTVAGLLAGYFPPVDMVLMRVMDGMMAVPPILVAIILVAVIGPSIPTVVIAITVPEIPRVTRLVRATTLSLRHEAFIEAARTLATPPGRILLRHILPNAVPALVVQGTFIAASAIMSEAILSFLGLGLPPDVPTWGNIMAEARVQFALYPMTVFLPALMLVPTLISINIIGDALRDVFDPRQGGKLL